MANSRPSARTAQTIQETFWTKEKSHPAASSTRSSPRETSKMSHQRMYGLGSFSRVLGSRLITVVILSTGRKQAQSRDPGGAAFCMLDLLHRASLAFQKPPPGSFRLVLSRLYLLPSTAQGE